MSTHKKIDVICIAVVVFAVILTALLMNGKLLGSIPVMGETVGSDLFSVNDLDADWDTASATQITLSDEGSTVKGNGAYVYDGNVHIAYAGHYVLSGVLTDGSLMIEAEKNDKIWVLLDGVTIHCDDGAAIRIEQADHVFLTLADGTENVISSGMTYDEEVVDAGVDGTIYSRDDLTINGTGALTVDAAYRHGIVCNDDLAITGGDIAIDAVQDGIHVNDSVRVKSAAISVCAGDDGITVSNDDETAFFYMESGNIQILESYEGIEAVALTVAGGTIDIVATDDGMNASGSGENSSIRIIDGDITITNATGRDADGLDSNGDIYVEGGRVFISVANGGGNCALDYGSENGGVCVVSGGTVIACGDSAMAEGFDADSTQGFLMYQTTAAAGATIRLEDAEGRGLLSEEIPCSFSSVVLSTPGLQVGDVCTITVDDVSEQVTIDNTSSSGMGSNGMFRGGMSRGGNRGNITNAQEIPAMGMMEAPDDAMRFHKGEIPNEMEAPDGVEVHEEMEVPDGVEVHEEMEVPDGVEVPEEMEAPDQMERPENGSEEDRQEMRKTGGRRFAPDAEQGQGNGAGFRQQDKGQMRGEEELAAPAVSVGALVLVGISMAVLLAGLLIAAVFRSRVNMI